LVAHRLSLRANRRMNHAVHTAAVSQIRYRHCKGHAYCDNWWRKLHRWKWKDVRRRLTGPNGRWARPSADGIELFNIASVPVTGYLYRGSKIPTLGSTPNHA
jgi:hypothetical protein